MLQVWQLIEVALFVSAVAAFREAEYTKVADVSLAAPTDSIVDMRTVISVLLSDNSEPEIDHHDNHVEWTHGSTKLDITLEWSKASGDSWKKARAGISTKACNDADVLSSENVYPGAAAAQLFEWDLIYPSEEITGPSGGKKVTYALVRPLVISLPKAQCAYVEIDSLLQAAVAVTPSDPEFPETFYSGVESTHVKKGYTRYGSEAYSHTCDAVSFAFYNDDIGFKRVIGDYKNGKVWHITSPNSTYPNGVCWSEEMGQRKEFIEGGNGGLVSSAKFLGFVKPEGSAATYVGSGQKIRGVPTDQWSYQKKQIGEDGSEERVTVHLYFSSPEWHFSKGSGHRILQRVEITGHTDDVVKNTSTAIDNSYEYIDFRPFLPPWAGFEPCEIMPGGEGCECLNLGCIEPGAADREFVTTFASPASCEQIGATTGGNSEKKKRDLMLVWFFGVLIGAVLAAVATFLVQKYRQMRTEQHGKELEIPNQNLGGAGIFGAFAPSTGVITRSEPYIDAL